MDVTRLSVELERLLPRCLDESLDPTRRYVYAMYAVEKLEELELAGHGTEIVERRLLAFEEQLLAVVRLTEKLRPAVVQPYEEEPSAPTDRPRRRRRRTENAEEPTTADDLKSDLEELTASLKSSSLEMHSKLTNQHRNVLDRIDESTSTNDAGVTKARTSLRELQRRTARRFFANMSSLFGIGLTFGLTYVLIKFFPKQPSCQ